MGWAIGIMAVGFGDVWYEKFKGQIKTGAPVLLIGQAIAGTIILILTNIRAGLGIGFALLLTLGILYKYGL
jgi:hypothetical protein